MPVSNSSSSISSPTNSNYNFTLSGQHNYFWDIFTKAERGEIPQIKTMRFPYQLGLGVFFSVEDIEKERKALGPLFAQEYETSFLSAENAAIESSLIEQSQVLDTTEEW